MVWIYYIKNTSYNVQYIIIIVIKLYILKAI